MIRWIAFVGLVWVMVAPLSQAQTQAAHPQFEVASIKTSTGCENPGSKGAGPSPGRLDMRCTKLADLIRAAYGLFANGVSRNPQSLPVSGGPAWIDSDLYDINAKAEGNPRMEMMMGPMLQALLEDRFKVKVHHETREVPVYALTGVKGGFKLKQLEAGSCTPMTFPPTPFAPGQKPACGRSSVQKKGPNLTLDMYGMSMTELCKSLSSRLDRAVIDKTGITGMFDFHLEFSPDDGGAAPPDDTAGPSIFTAVQEQLGLKLEPAKGPGEFLVIDNAEKPSEN